MWREIGLVGARASPQERISHTSQHHVLAHHRVPRCLGVWHVSPDQPLVTTSIAACLDK